MRFEHVGIYLDSLSSVSEMRAFFGGSPVEKWQKSEAALAAEVHQFSGVKFEFLQQQGRTALGIDHLAFSTDDFSATRSRLLEAGAIAERQFTNQSGKRILFVLWNNMRVEIMEK